MLSSQSRHHLDMPGVCEISREIRLLVYRLRVEGELRWVSSAINMGIRLFVSIVNIFLTKAYLTNSRHVKELKVDL